MKKVLIMTLEQGENYGGILQAYALQDVIKQLGYNPTTTYIPKQPAIIKYSKYILRSLLHVIKPSISNLSKNDKHLITAKTMVFIHKNINLIHWDKIKKIGLEKLHVEALIVGSDQVWRSAYVSVEKYLFDFSKNITIKRISYAASFGRNDLCEYSQKLIRKTSYLAKKMNAISVREDSGINLVKEKWGVVAKQHVDPTLLLKKEQYIELIFNDLDNTTQSQGNLFAYVLDRGEGNGEIIDRSAELLDMKVFEIMPPKVTSSKTLHANLDRYTLPPVSQWLRSFMDADFIVTDSFHGTVFSIIFNKPFITIGNKVRGLARFNSLLNLFGLEDRLISNVKDITTSLLDKKIDWNVVNAIKVNEQRRSVEYLKRYLGVINV